METAKQIYSLSVLKAESIKISLVLYGVILK